MDATSTFFPLDAHLHARAPNNAAVECFKLGDAVKHRSWRHRGEVVALLNHATGMMVKVKFDHLQDPVLLGIEWIERVQADK